MGKTTDELRREISGMEYRIARLTEMIKAAEAHRLLQLQHATKCQELEGLQRRWDAMKVQPEEIP